MRTKLYSNVSNTGRSHSKPKMGAVLLLLLGFGLFSSPVQAQFTLNCPQNVSVPIDSGSCDAVVNYALPFITGGPISDTTYAFTGSQQIYVVPANISRVSIETWGGQGMTNGFGTVNGGLGGYASGDLVVSPGDTLFIYVGDGGATTTTGGFNGGGNAGTVGCATAFGGGGGGASDVRYGGIALTNRVIVAGGGGGAGGNRVQGCGRGTGGGGGGGYYGGGGGAAWPSSAGVLPTGATQAAGGSGGTSSYTSVANNNGTNGALGTGGTGGDETTSSQSGSGIALAGGGGGGLAGLGGAYNVNWTGQSGAGGSGYIGGVLNDSMATGIWAGAGQVRISFDQPFTLTQTAGLPTGATFPLGNTMNTYAVQQGSNSDTCSFMVTVLDNVAPVIANCPAMDTIYMGATCQGAVPDYSTVLNITDNCSAPIVTQNPASGSMLMGIGSMNAIMVMASDSGGNVDSCAFIAVLVDSTSPTFTSCPATEVFTPTTLDCNPSVNFTPPAFTDNCAATATSTHQPGDNFPVGTTSITYTATDSSGNVSTCTFDLQVNQPSLSIVSMSPMQACEGDTITLDAGSGFMSYLWSDNSTGSTTIATVGGIQWVEVSDMSGCTGRDSFMVMINPTPTPVITPNGGTLCTGGNYATYQWYQNMVAVTGATDSCFTPTTDGNFYVTVTDGIGCEGSSDTLAFVGMREALNNPGFNIYPNPAQDRLVIDLDQPLNQKGEIVLYDLTGRIVLQKGFSQLPGSSTLSLGQVSAGSYILEIKSENFLGRKRLIRVE